MKLQDAYITLENLLNKDVNDSILSFKEFKALNLILLELTCKSEYELEMR